MPILGCAPPCRATGWWLVGADNSTTMVAYIDIELDTELVEIKFTVLAGVLAVELISEVEARVLAAE